MSGSTRRALLSAILFLLWMAGLGGCASAGLPVIPPDLPTLTSPFPTPSPDGLLTPTPALQQTESAPSSPIPTLLPTDTPAPTSPTPLACWGDSGRIEQGMLPPSFLPEPLNYRVYLPPCYDQQPARRYPVLYLIHGQSFIDDQWERLGATKTADALIASGQAAPFIIVMPRDRLWSEPADDKFGKALPELLVPWIDEQYRTIPDRAHRAVGGLSRGGAWALHFGLNRWDLFGTIGMHSGFAFHGDIPYIKQWLYAIPEDQMPRIFMDVSDNDRPEIMESSIWFEDLLTQRGIPHEWHIFAGEHNESYWQGHIEEYMRFYIAAWMPAN